MSLSAHLESVPSKISNVALLYRKLEQKKKCLDATFENFEFIMSDSINLHCQLN